MLPDALRKDLQRFPVPDDYIVQVLKQAVDDQKQAAKIRSIKGKYKAVPTSSDYFSRNKQMEIQMER